MTDRKLSKRLYLTLVQSEKRDPTPSYDDGSPIFSLYQHFRLRYMHVKGSNRPRGYYHDATADASVTIRWLWTEDHDFFAPDVSFSPRPIAHKVVRRLIAAMDKIGGKLTPENLCEELQAMIVEEVPNESGCYDDYRPVRIPGEPFMLTIARAVL